jgi:hypothetical protein
MACEKGTDSTRKRHQITAASSKSKCTLPQHRKVDMMSTSINEGAPVFVFKIAKLLRVLNLLHQLRKAHCKSFERSNLARWANSPKDIDRRLEFQTHGIVCAAVATPASCCCDWNERRLPVGDPFTDSVGATHARRHWSRVGSCKNDPILDSLGVFGDFLLCSRRLVWDFLMIYHPKWWVLCPNVTITVIQTCFGSKTGCRLKILARSRRYSLRTACALVRWDIF